MADDVREALLEAAQLLKDIQDGTKDILDDSTTKKPIRSTKGVKTSSWAKSSTPRTNLPTAPVYSTHNVEETAQLSTKSKSSGGYTIPKSSREIRSAASDVPYYDVNIDVVSTKKRPISAVVMTKSESCVDKMDRPTPCTPPENATSQPIVESTTRGEGAAFSFGKSKRDVDLSTRHAEVGPSRILDVSRGEQMLWRKPQTSFVFDKAKREFGTDPKPNKDNFTSDGASAQPESHERNSAEEGGSGSDSASCRRRPSTPPPTAVPRQDILSTRQRAPEVSIAPEHKTKPRRRPDPTPGDISTPGPGAYSDAVCQATSIANGRGVRFNPGPSRAAKKARRIINATRADSSAGRAPGPGYYDVTTADTSVRHKVAGFANMFRPGEADRKLTPQLQRKRCGGGRISGDAHLSMYW